MYKPECRLTEYLAHFEELSPAHQRAEAAVADGCAGWWQTHWPHVVCELHRRVHSQQRDVIDEHSVFVPK